MEKASDDYRAWIRDLSTGPATEAGVRDPSALGTQLQLVHDGAGITARMDRSPAVRAASLAAATALVDCALG